jgi:hypothetical protein
MRNRSSAIALTENTKKRISTEINNPLLSEIQKQQKFSDIIESKLKNENRLKPLKPFETSDILDLPIPQFLDIRKEYISKEEKVI